MLTQERFNRANRLAAQLKKTFDAFGSSLLSPREGDITRLILRGHLTKAIAILFGNSPETVKAHPKRIYVKLKVSSQGELLSLFLEALRHMQVGSKGDPLVEYTRLTRLGDWLIINSGLGLFANRLAVKGCSPCLHMFTRPFLHLAPF